MSSDLHTQHRPHPICTDHISLYAKPRRIQTSCCRSQKKNRILGFWG